MTIIALPNGKNAEFPDDMSHDQIKNILRKKFPPQNNDFSQDNLEKNQKQNQLNYLTGAQSTPFDKLRDVAAGAIGGLGRGGQFIANKLTGGYAPNVDWDQIESNIESKNPYVGKDLLKGVSSYAPYGIAGGPGFLGQVGAGALSGAAQARPGESEGLEALKGAGINALTKGIFEGANALRPSRLLKTHLSPEELLKRSELAENTPTGLGSIIDSPFLTRQYENVLSKIPLSGATNKLQEAGTAVNNKALGILNKLLGDYNPESATDELHNALIKQSNIHQEMKNALYNDVEKEANKQFLDLPLSNFSNKAKEYKDLINDTVMLKHDPDIKNILKKLNVYENTTEKIKNDKSLVNERGEPILGKDYNSYKYPTLKEANLLKGKLNRTARSLKSSPNSDDRYKAGIIKDLASSLRKDIHDAIDNSENNSLKEKYEKAEKNYAENFHPFLDKDIYKYTHGNADPDTIVQNFIKTSRSADRSKKLEGLTKKLLPQERSLLGYSYLSRALDNEGNLNNRKLSTLIGNLGKNQLKTLFPDKSIRNQILDYNRLYKMNTKGVNMMENPLTGQQNMDLIPFLTGRLGSSVVGGFAGGIPGAIAGMVMPGMIGKKAVNWLTSPTNRKKMVNALIENKDWNKDIPRYIQAALQKEGYNK